MKYMATSLFGLRSSSRHALVSVLTKPSCKDMPPMVALASGVSCKVKGDTERALSETEVFRGDPPIKAEAMMSG